MFGGGKRLGERKKPKSHKREYLFLNAAASLAVKEMQMKTAIESRLAVLQ